MRPVIGGAAQAATGSGKQRWRRLRPGRSGAVVAIVALALAGGGSYAVAQLTAEPPPPNYAGDYALFLGGSFAGPVHAFKGCTTDIEAVLSREYTPEGSVVERQVPNQQVPVSCEIEVGLGMSLSFKDEVDAALRGGPADLDFAIARVRPADGVVTSELRFRGYVSDVTLPTLRAGADPDPSWLRVELVSETGTVTKVSNPGTRVPGLTEQPVEASQPRITLTGVDPAGLDQLGPLSVTREDIRPTDTRTRGDTYFPGAKRVASPQLGVRDSFLRTVNGVAGWFDAQLPSRTPNLKTLGVTYRDASGRHLLSIELNGFPTHFDPYERTDGRRVLRLAANPDPQSVDWR